MAEDSRPPRDRLIGIVKRAPMISALLKKPMDRRDLEQDLEISKSTAHRNTTQLAEWGLVERANGEYNLTEYGEAIAEVVARFEAEMRTTSRLAPLYDAVADIQPGCPVNAFSEAIVTTANQGDPFGPLARFVSLVEDTNTLQMFDSYAVAPTYIDDVHGRVLDGLETKVIERPDVAEDIIENYPQKCIELCASEYLTMRLHEGLPFGLVIFDSRIGVGVRDPDTGAPHAFVDTDDPEARAWAETLFDSFWPDATRLRRFNPKALREAIGSSP